MDAIKKILVPTDFSEFSLASVEYATSLATSYRAEIWVLHVVDDAPIVAFPKVDKGSDAARRDAEEAAMGRLTELVGSRFSGHGIVRRVVRQGDPCTEIVKFAQEEKMDLVVMATHGRTGLSHMLMGSVAEKVVRHSMVPVLSIKPKPIRAIALKPEDIQEQLHFRSGRGLSKAVGKKKE